MIRSFFITCLLVLSNAVIAAPEKYVFDKGHTNIMWFASHFGFSYSMGQFDDYEGTVILDEEAPENSSIDVTIKADSVTTGQPEFDDHLRAQDFLDVANHPTIHFKSLKVVPKGEDAVVHGNLTLLGKTKLVTMNVSKNRIGINPYNKKKTAGFSGKLKFNRSDWGMNYGTPGISDKVVIRIETELWHENDAPASE